jgi:CDP-diacylglycerol--glycerol-3-phosphate 3-phosphatidyltransferase
VLSRSARPAAARILNPIARTLLRLGLTPDLLTALGTLGVLVGALGFLARGSLLTGTLVIAAFVAADSIDGTMARLSGQTSAWGAFLDSTLDRVADGAIFAALAYWFAATGNQLGTGLALASLVLGQLVSYSKARGESLGATVEVGIVERTERVVLVLSATLAVGLGAPVWVLQVALGVLAVGSLVTVGQRMAVVRRQTKAVAP